MGKEKEFLTRKVMLMATARRYTMEQIEAARKKLRSLPVKEAGKTRGEVAEFLVNDIKKAMRLHAAGHPGLAGGGRGIGSACQAGRAV